MISYDPNRGTRRRSLNRRKRAARHFWFWAVVAVIAAMLMAWAIDHQGPGPQGAWCGDHLCTYQERAVYR